MENFEIRDATPADLVQLASIASAVPFLNHRFVVALIDNRVASFLSWREVFPGEREILQLETLASFRNCGLARKLLQKFQLTGGTIFLEVRQSNRIALHLYQSMGFVRMGERKEYYHSPPENGIVLRHAPC